MIMLHAASVHFSLRASLHLRAPPHYAMKSAVFSEASPQQNTDTIICAGLAVRSILQAAKFLYSSESSSRPDEGEKSCKRPYKPLCPVFQPWNCSSRSLTQRTRAQP